MPTATINVRFRWKTGKHLPWLSISHFDPHETLHHAPTVEARHCCSGYGQLVFNPSVGAASLVCRAGAEGEGEMTAQLLVRIPAPAY
jgi:hypothetical protein